MNSRERFLATFNYGSPDRMFLWPQWAFPETVRRWQREGLPADVHLNTYFGFDRIEFIPLDCGPLPRLETKIVRQGDGWCEEEDEFGGLLRRWTDGRIGMPQWLRYPLRDRETWEKLKLRLNPDAPARYPEHWDYLRKCYALRDFPLGLGGFSFYGWMRNWAGLETLSLWFYDMPDLVEEMLEFFTDFLLRLSRRALNEAPGIDFVNIWEDMAMKTGPLLGPELFSRFISPRLKRVTAALRGYGIPIIMVDSDGCVGKLIPLWLEAGVNLVYPLEVAAGCDAVRYREQFGKRLRLMGNIDKRVLREGCSESELEREVMSKVPRLAAEGGFSPMVDHAVPPDVPFARFKRYIELVRSVSAARQ